MPPGELSLARVEVNFGIDVLEAFVQRLDMDCLKVKQTIDPRRAYGPKASDEFFSPRCRN